MAIRKIKRVSTDSCPNCLERGSKKKTCDCSFRRALKIGVLILENNYDAGDPAASAGDLISDILHYCYQQRLDVEGVMANAQWHFEEEIAGRY